MVFQSPWSVEGAEVIISRETEIYPAITQAIDSRNDISIKDMIALVESQARSNVSADGKDEVAYLL
jgi:hypothetical protein